MKHAFWIVLLFLAGCDEGFDPYTEVGPAFVLNGTLVVGADTQRVRVQPLRQQQDVPPSVAVTFRSEGPDGSVLWEVRTLGGEAGQPVRIASTALPLQPGATYNLIATAATGVTTATLRVPDTLTLDVLTAQTAPDTAFVLQPLRLAAALDQPEEVTVEYVIQATADTPPMTYARTYDTRASVGGRMWTVDLAEDLDAARREAGAAPGATVVLVRAHVGYELFAPGGITNGFGSLSVEAAYRTEWAVPDTLLPYLRATRP